MKVTIFTDASVQQSKCGFAFYIGCRTGKIQKAGKLKIETSDTLLAEMHSLANALHTLKHSKFTDITEVDIYCDQKQVVSVVSNKQRGFRSQHHREVSTEIMYLMMEICLKHGKSLRSVGTFFTVKHIRAHTGKTDKLSLINDWCDKQAKRYAKPPKPKRK